MNTTENTEPIDNVQVESPQELRSLSECDDEHYLRQAEDKKFKEQVRWYVCYVQSQHELQVHDYLMGLEQERKKTRRGKSKKEDLVLTIDPSKIKMECYVPLQRVRVKYSDRMVWKDKILIPSIVFVHCSLNDRAPLFEGKMQEYIRGFMSDKTKHRPMPIPDDQMEKFRSLADDEYAIQMVEPSFQIGQVVNVLAGPMAGHQAELLSTKDIVSKTDYKTDRLGNKILDAEGNPVPKHTVRLLLRLNENLGAVFEMNADDVAIVPTNGKKKKPTK